MGKAIETGGERIMGGGSVLMSAHFGGETGAPGDAFGGQRGQSGAGLLVDGQLLLEVTDGTEKKEEKKKKIQAGFIKD